MDCGRLSGVRVTRRTVLKGSMATFTGLGLSLVARGSRAPTGGDAYEDFVLRWTGTLQKLLEEHDPDEDRYLFELCALIRRVPLHALPRMSTPSRDRSGIRSGGVWSENELMLVELQMEPGAIIPAHNHVGYSFVSLGISGSCLIRHFEPLDDVPPKSTGRSKTFRVRESRSSVLTLGRMSHLSRTRDNIHWFRAGRVGATIIDFGTKFPDPGEGYRAFSGLEVSEAPVDDLHRIYEGQWIGNPFA